MKKNSISIFIFLCFMSCLPSNEFEKNIFIPSHDWKSNFEPSFDFDIADTTAKYKIYVLLRHTDAYLFSNIWLRIDTKEPNKTEFSKQNVELPLATKLGKWTGKGFNEIWEHKIALTGNGFTKFDKKGIYTIKLKQIMRQDPLPEVMSVGLSIEKEK